MGIFNQIKRAFGFGGEDEESDDNIYNDAPVTIAPSQPRNRNVSSHDADSKQNRAKDENANASDTPSPHDLALKIFDGVVEIFNRNLPDFLAKSVNPEAQKRLLLDSIDEGVKRHIENMHTIAVEQCSRQWADEKNSIQASMKDIDRKSKEMETRTNEMREKQLSAERQKRALAERVHDLESTVAKLEAEKDQYELEVKSMLNKVKVASVHEKENEELRAEIVALRSGNAPAVDTKALEKANAAAEQLAQQIKGKDEELATLKASIEELTSEKANLEEAVSTLEMKDKMSSAMVNDMQSKTSDSRRLAEQKQNELDEANTRIADLEKRLAEAEALNEEIVEVSSQLENFQTVKDKLEERIANLKQSLHAEKEANATLKTEIESLNDTIRQNLEQHAALQSELQAQIETLKADAARRPASDDKQSRRRRERNRGNGLPIDNDTSDIDNILGDTNWLVSQPPENHSMRPDTSEPTNDFGYHEPPKRHSHPDNDAQMSLF